MEKIIIELSNLYPNALDIVPEDFDYKKNRYALEFKFGENVEDKTYCEDVDLQIRLVGFKNNKLYILRDSEDIDKKLNKYIFKTCKSRIVRKNIFKNAYYDKDKYNLVLQYYIRKYKE